MAQQVQASIYGMNLNDWGGTGGFGMTFPTSGISFLPVPTPITMGSVTMKSVVKIWIADGEPEYYTDKTVADLLTDSNT